MRPLLAFGLILALVLGIAGVTALAAWGNYTELERVEIPYDKFTSASVTWYTFSKAYNGTVYFGVQNLLTYNASATEQKAVLWFGTTDYHIDLVFFGNGVVDINEVDPNGATKIGGFSGWNTYEYVVVKFDLDNKKVEVLDPNGTVIASVTYAITLNSLSQVGASGADGAVTAGSVIVAVLQPPIDFSAVMSDTMAAITSLLSAILPLAIAIGVMSAIFGMLKKVMGSLT